MPDVIESHFHVGLPMKIFGGSAIWEVKFALVCKPHLKYKKNEKKKKRTSIEIVQIIWQSWAWPNI